MKKHLIVFLSVVGGWAGPSLAQAQSGTSAACRLDGGAGCGGLGRTSPLVDADISSSAAIAWSKISKTGAVAGDVGAVALQASNPGVEQAGTINLGECPPETADCLSWLYTGGLSVGAHMSPPYLVIEAIVTGNPADKPAGTYLYTATQLDPTLNRETVAGPTQSCVLADYGTCRLVLTYSENQPVFYADQGTGTIQYRGMLTGRDFDLVDDGSHLTWSPGTPPVTDTTTHPFHVFSEDGAMVSPIAEINEVYTYGPIHLTGGSKNGYQPGEESITLDPNGISPSVGRITMVGGTVEAANFLGNATTATTATSATTATTATALAANGTNCSAGQAASGVDASGNAEGCTAYLTTLGNQWAVGFDGQEITHAYFGGGVTDSTALGFTLHATGGSGSNNAGANFSVQPGVATGTAASGDFYVLTGVPRATGSTAQSPTVRSSIRAKQTTLTESTATSVVTIPVAASKVVGGRVIYTVSANDGTDFQATTGVCTFAAVDKAGTVTASTPQCMTESSAASSGTLTSTWTAVASTTNVILKCNAVSSLTQTVLEVHTQLALNGDDTTGTVTWN